MGSELLVDKFLIDLNYILDLQLLLAKSTNGKIIAGNAILMTQSIFDQKVKDICARIKQLPAQSVSR